MNCGHLINEFNIFEIGKLIENIFVITLKAVKKIPSLKYKILI